MVREDCAKGRLRRPKALELAMAWDETTYGREYDLTYQHVAVDFNFGADGEQHISIRALPSRHPDTALATMTRRRGRRARVFWSTVGN
jgi:hypothetical protein